MTSQAGDQPEENDAALVELDDDELFRLAAAIAKARGERLQDVIERGLKAYVEDPPAGE